MDELERFRIRMIGEEHNRRRRAKRRSSVTRVRALLSMLKAFRVR